MSSGAWIFARDLASAFVNAKDAGSSGSLVVRRHTPPGHAGSLVVLRFHEAGIREREPDPDLRDLELDLRALRVLDDPRRSARNRRKRAFSAAVSLVGMRGFVGGH